MRPGQAPYSAWPGFTFWSNKQCSVILMEQSEHCFERETYSFTSPCLYKSGHVKADMQQAQAEQPVARQVT
jgi:hypothetical protein